jgi:hypothetical protein
VEKFSFNKIRFAAGFLAFLWLASVTLEDNRELKTNRHEVAIEGLLTLVLAASLVWLVTVRLELGRHGLTYKSLTGSRAMRRKDVSKLFISWRQRYLMRIIPWYRAFRVEVVDRRGNRLVFGNRLHHMPGVAERVGELATEQVTPLLLAEFDAGRTVDFGILTVSQKAGVRVGEQSIKWADLVSVDVTETEMGIARRLGPPVVLPLRRVSMPAVCEAVIRQGLHSTPATA